jgi:hypothetical protein
MAATERTPFEAWDALYEAERLLKDRAERALQNESNCLRIRQFNVAKYWQTQHELASAAQRAVAALLER